MHINQSRYVCICVGLSPATIDYETSYGIDSEMQERTIEVQTSFTKIQEMFINFSSSLLSSSKWSLFHTPKVQLSGRILKGTVIVVATASSQVIAHFLSPRLPWEIFILGRTRLGRPPLVLQDL